MLTTQIQNLDSQNLFGLFIDTSLSSLDSAVTESNLGDADENSNSIQELSENKEKEKIENPEYEKEEKQYEKWFEDEWDRILKQHQDAWSKYQKDDQHDKESVVERIEDDVMEETQELENEFIQDYEDPYQSLVSVWKKDNFTPMEIVKNSAWLVNLVCIGFPWILLSSFFVIYNVLVNVIWNKYWAGGNMYLVANTVYAISQMLMSWPLVCEFSIYLRRFKFLRVLSFWSAIIYSTVTLFIFFSWIFDLIFLPRIESEEEYDKTSIFDMFLNMFMIYNTIVHISIVPINIVIVAKEMELYFFQLLSSLGKGVRTARDSVLTANDAYHTVSFWSEDWFLNPAYFFKRFEAVWDNVFNQKNDKKIQWTSDTEERKKFMQKFEEKHKKPQKWQFPWVKRISEK